MRPTVQRMLVWGAGPIAVAVVAGWLSHRQARGRQGRYVAETAALAPAARQALEAAVPLAVANAIWAGGSVDAVRAMARIELDRLPQTEGPRRARVFMRFGIVDTNPDGQAALFGQVCVADPDACTHQKEAALRETQARFVSPGNMLPPFFLAGHPHVAAPP